MVSVIVIKRKIVSIALLALSFAIVISLLYQPIQGFLAVNSEKEAGVRVPILMYHSILKDPAKANKYVVSPKTFKDDLLYLKANGYESVFVSDLVAYVHEGIALPEKPVVITLDDGYLNNLTYVLPILEELNMKAVISVVGIFTDKFTEANDPNPNYSHFSWDDIKTVYNSKLIEIGNHSYNLHKVSERRGVMKKQGETLGAYHDFLVKDLGMLQDRMEEKIGFRPEVFTYPYGLISEETEPIIKEMGFTAALTCFEKINYLTRDPEKLYSLNRFNRPNGISTADFMKKIIE